MKVAVVAPTPVPFTRGGAERAWAGLHAALIEAGHDAEVVKLPVREQTLGDLVAGYRAFAALDLTHFDVVISSKYPAWMISHPHHVLWMFHPLRGLYDTYHLFNLPLTPGPVAPEVAALLSLVEGPPDRTVLDEVFARVDAAVRALGPEHPQLAIPGPVSRLVVHWLDRLALEPPSIRRHATLSATIAGRADYLPAAVRPRVAHAPSDLVVPPGAVPPPPGGRAPGSYFFTTSRLDGPKRLDLLVRAMTHVPGDIRLLLGGTGPEEERLRLLAADDDRIELLGFVPDDDLPGLYAGARAVPFVPYDEDYGLITVEALALGTPVVTCRDSGGPTELLRDGVDGLVTAPDPAALGAALAQLATDPDRARRMGETGRRRAGRITWPAVVDTLLGPDDGARSTRPRTVTGAPRPGTGTGVPDAAIRPTTDARATAGRPGPRPRRASRRDGRLRVVVLTTFRVAERGHGGQLRSFHLYGALARHADVEIVSLTPDDGPAGSIEIAPGFVETAVPRSEAHAEEAEVQSRAVGTPMSDVVAGSEIARTPEYLARLREAAVGADVVILAEPYLLPALAAAGIDHLPFVYDAFNVEADLKVDVMPASPAGDDALRRIVAVETEASRRAAAITACSSADAARLAELGGRPRTDATVVPNGTDITGVVVPTPEERAAAGARWLARHGALDPRHGEARGLAVFFGSWHPPNLAAAEVLLGVAEEAPDVVFVLGGRHGDAFADRRLPPNVTFPGVVSERTLRTLLRTAHVALNPMVFGSGTNLKIIEYLATGIPVVSTAIGTRGLDLVAGEHLLVAAPDDLATTIAEVLDDPSAAAGRAAAGRALVERLYTWPLLGDRLYEVVRRVAGSVPAADVTPPVASGAAEAVR